MVTSEFQISDWWGVARTYLAAALQTSAFKLRADLVLISFFRPNKTGPDHALSRETQSRWGGIPAFTAGCDVFDLNYTEWAQLSAILGATAPQVNWGLSSHATATLCETIGSIEATRRVLCPDCRD